MLSVVRDTLIDIATKQISHLRLILSRQQVHAHIFGVPIAFASAASRSLRLVVAAHGHREGESDYEREERKRGCQNDVEIGPFFSPVVFMTLRRSRSPR